MKLSAAYVVVLAAWLCIADATTTTTCSVDPKKSGIKLDLVSQELSGSPDHRCFTIQPSTTSCSGSCCKADVAKFEFDINPACAKGTTVTARLFGQDKPLAVQWVSISETAAMLRLKPNKALASSYWQVPSPDFQQLCLDLEGTCDSLEKLCKGSTCKVAATSSDAKCCAMWGVPNPPGCEVCVTFYTYEWDKEVYSKSTCDAALKVVTEAYKASAPAGMALASPWSIKTCQHDQAAVCARVADWHLVRDGKLDGIDQRLGSAYLDLVGGCPIHDQVAQPTIGYRIESDCGGLGIDAGNWCYMASSGFPTTSTGDCDSDYKHSPFQVLPDVKVSPGRKAGASWYCWEVVTGEAIPGDYGCEKSTTLQTIQIWADDSKRSAVTGAKVVYGNGSTKTLTPRWGPKSGDNTLILGGLAWSTKAVDASKPQVCVELTGVALKSFCEQYSYKDACVLWLLDPKENCCPAYPSHIHPAPGK